MNDIPHLRSIDDGTRSRATARPQAGRTRRRARPSGDQGEAAQRRPHSRPSCVLVLLCGALGIGFWQHYRLHAQVMATAEQRRDFVPTVRAAPVRASASTMTVTWPGTTEAFEQANIYARASGYISKRDVDIGSQVKAGRSPCRDHGPRSSSIRSLRPREPWRRCRASLQQAKANRDLAQVTWDRDSRWSSKAG